MKIITLAQCLTLSAILVLLTSCHSLPSAEKTLAKLPPQPELVIRDGSGRLAPEDAASAIREAAGDKADLPWLHDLMSGEQKLTGATLTAGNKLNLLMDGPETFEAIYRDIREARHHIHIETFIFLDDEIGQEMADLLIEKASQGVSVRVLYDSVGSIKAKRPFFDRMRAGGVQVYEWRPFNMITMLPWWHSHVRHHRKLFIIDGRIGYAGGINISRVYLKSSFSPPRKPMLDNRWRDTQIRVEGPAVADLQRLFVELWVDLTREPDEIFENASYYPPLEKLGTALVRVVASTGGNRVYEQYYTHMLAMMMAQERIWITQGYFAPNRAFLQMLGKQASSSVDVQVLLPGFTDAWITFHSSQGTYTPLLNADAKLYERQDALLHAKTAIVDDVWCTVGSTNLDWRSFAHNNELNLYIIDTAFVKELEAMFELDRSVMHQLDAEEWSNRPFKNRVLEFFGKIVRYWL